MSVILCIHFCFLDSGGIRITVEGKNLDSVAEPLMTITRTDTGEQYTAVSAR